jgi:UDP-glucose 4-epimerase
MGVLVTGGAGYVGSHVVVALLDAGRDVLIADDFSNARRDVVDRIAEAARGRRPRIVEVDVTDAGQLESALAGEPIDAVIHAAGSVDVVGATNVRETVGEVPFVFSSSASVSTARRGAVRSKSTTRACRTRSTAWPPSRPSARSWRRATARSPLGILRYFHAAGAHPAGTIGREADVGATLMSRLEQAALGEAPSVTLYGGDYPTRDGTAIRDYVHVADIADAHVLALGALEARAASFVLNLGSARGYTVREIVAAFEASVGRRLATVAGPRRDGDPPELWANAARAQGLLGWRPQRSIVQMCNDALRWRRYAASGPFLDGRRPTVVGSEAAM